MLTLIPLTRCPAFVIEVTSVYDRALTIGMAAESAGMARPTNSAWTNAINEGIGARLNPMSAVKRKLYRSASRGKEQHIARKIDGSTNISACSKIINTYPFLLNPNNLRIPLSNYFASVVILNSEYIRMAEIPINKTITTLKRRLTMSTSSDSISI